MRIFLFLTVLAGVVFAHEAQAQKAFSHCDQATHTGDILACLNKRNDKAAADLNKIYDDVLRTQLPENLENFYNVQTEWLQYRDQECAWQAAQVDTESLRRVKELSCLTDLTIERSAGLELFVKDQQVPFAEKEMGYEPFPRWMNVVANEYPDIFWRYGDHLKTDLDCDGQKEEIMLGWKVGLSMPGENAQSSHNVEAVISITDNPITGKPRSVLFFMNSDDEEGVMCDPNPKLTVVNYNPPPLDEEGPEAAAQCDIALQVKAGACSPRLIFWDGQTYSFDPPIKE